MKLVHGAGTNDADYVVKRTVNGKPVRCRFYTVWSDMLRKCFNPQYPGVAPCEVDERWRSFMAFREWMLRQRWGGMQLNANLLGDGSIYSPETCVFVPCHINKLFNFARHRESGLPLGVSRNRDYYQITMKMRGRRKTGYFDSCGEAASAYIEAKTEYVRSLYPEISKIDPRLPQACENKLQQLRAK